MRGKAKGFICSCLAALFCVSGVFFAVGCKSGEDGAHASSQINEETNGKIRLRQTFAGEELCPLSNVVQNFLSMNDRDSLSQILSQYTGSDVYQNSKITLLWKSNRSGNYKVSVADNAAFEDAWVFETSISKLDLNFLVPGKTYYYKVKGTKEGDESSVDYFTTKANTVRYVLADGGANIRDLGGWQTESGKRVRYELLYRGNMINGYNGGPKLTEQGIDEFVNKLKIKSEIDLRGNSDNGGQSFCWFDKENESAYLQAPMTQYTMILPVESGNDRAYGQQKENLQAIFDFLSDENNYPVYFHCNAGADRTGTLAFLINGLLGVPYEDLAKDFELTSFSSASGGRYRSKIDENGKFDDSGVMQNDSGNYVAFELMYKLMMENYANGGTLSQAIENYLIGHCEIPVEQLNELKKIMLG